MYPSMVKRLFRVVSRVRCHSGFCQSALSAMQDGDAQCCVVALGMASPRRRSSSWQRSSGLLNNTAVTL